MKKFKTILLIILVLGMTTACGKKGEPIILPDTADITSIEIQSGDISMISIDQAFVDEFMPLLQNMEITNKRSTRDAPAVDDYILINLNCDDQTTTIFYYEKNNVAYVEQPYQGIYKPTPELVESITDSSVLQTELLRCLFSGNGSGSNGYVYSGRACRRFRRADIFRPDFSQQ